MRRELSPRRPLPPSTALYRLVLRRLHRIYADSVALLVLVLELHDAVHDGEEAVVAGAADVAARVKLGAPLSDEDAAGRDELAAVSLHPQVLRARVAPVARGADAFLVCHRLPHPTFTSAILISVNPCRWPALRR